MRDIPCTETSAVPFGATAAFLARAHAGLAALPPGFTDDLRNAPAFPADRPELLGGD